MIKLNPIGQIQPWGTTTHAMPNNAAFTVTQASAAQSYVPTPRSLDVKWIIGGLFGVAAVVLIAKHTGHLGKLTGGSKASKPSDSGGATLS